VEKKKHEELILEAKNFFNANKKEFQEFLRSDEKIIQVEFPLITKFSPSLSETILEFPEETLALMENAFEEALDLKNPRIRLLNLPSSVSVPIREIRAKHLDQILLIEGLVKQASDVRPQVVNAKFECPSCGAILSVLQIDKNSENQADAHVVGKAHLNYCQKKW